MKKITKAEAMRRRRIVVALIQSGLGRAEVITQASSPTVSYPNGQMAEHAAARTYGIIMREWSRDHEGQQATARVEAIQRVRRDLAELRNPGQMRDGAGRLVWEVVNDRDGRPKKDAKGKQVRRPVKAPIDMARVVAHEGLLAKLEGSFAPLEIKVAVDATVRGALAAVIANMPAEKLAALEARGEELERLAAGQLNGSLNGAQHPPFKEDFHNGEDGEGRGGEGERRRR